MKAIFYQQRDWGLLEMFRKDVPEVPLYKILTKPDLNIATKVGENTPPMSVSATEETYTLVGRMPTGEAIFIRL